jgi:hypothetical protein
MFDPTIPTNQIAQRYNVSRTTIYEVAPRSLKEAARKRRQAGCSYTGEIPDERGRNRTRNSDRRAPSFCKFFPTPVLIEVTSGRGCAMSQGS